MKISYWPSVEIQWLRFGIRDNCKGYKGPLVFAGQIDNVDDDERIRQHSQTDACWKAILNRGIGENTIGRITGILKFPSHIDAQSFSQHRGIEWNIRVFTNDEADEWIVEVQSPEIEFTRMAFLHYTDMLLIDAVAYNGRFDGFQLEPDTKDLWD